VLIRPLERCLCPFAMVGLEEGRCLAGDVPKVQETCLYWNLEVLKNEIKINRIELSKPPSDSQ